MLKSPPIWEAMVRTIFSPGCARPKCRTPPQAGAVVGHGQHVAVAVAGQGHADIALRAAGKAMLQGVVHAFQQHQRHRRGLFGVQGIVADLDLEGDGGRPGGRQGVGEQVAGEAVERRGSAGLVVQLALDAGDQADAARRPPPGPAWPPCR